MGAYLATGSEESEVINSPNQHRGLKIDYRAEGVRYNHRWKRWEWVDSNGQYHREGDLPAIIYNDGTKRWYFHGLCHRDHGPDVVASNGYRAWHHKNELHRLDGPAIEYVGEEPSWYVDGEVCETPEAFIIKRDAYCENHNIPIPSGRLTKRATPT